jgi:hypothetical protein
MINKKYFNKIYIIKAFNMNLYRFIINMFVDQDQFIF